VARSVEAGQALLNRGPMIHDDGKEILLPWLLEQPKAKEGKPSGVKLDATLARDEHKAVGDSDIVQ